MDFNLNTEFCEELYDEVLPSRYRLYGTKRNSFGQLAHLPCPIEDLQQNFMTAMRYLPMDWMEIICLRSHGYAFGEIAQTIYGVDNSSRAWGRYHKALRELCAPINLQIINGCRKDNPEHTPTTQLDLYPRERHILVVHANINSVEQLCEYTEDELMGFRSVGVTTVEHIKCALDAHGLALAKP